MVMMGVIVLGWSSFGSLREGEWKRVLRFLAFCSISYGLEANARKTSEFGGKRTIEMVFLNFTRDLLTFMVRV